MWDVSERGLGLWSTELLTPGETVKITVGQPYLLVLEARVKWCDQKKTMKGIAAVSRWRSKALSLLRSIKCSKISIVSPKFISGLRYSGILNGRIDCK